MENYEYVNGYVERQSDGSYQGKLSIDGVDISPIIGVYFRKDKETYLWMKRKRMLEYDVDKERYFEREAQPRWEVYLKKQTANNIVSFVGEFFFLRFRFAIIGFWDKYLGNDKHHRLNLIVERMKMADQTIINKINERKRENV